MKKNTSIIITVIAVLTLAVVSLVQVFALDIEFDDEPAQNTVKVVIEEISESTTAKASQETEEDISQDTQKDEVITTAPVNESSDVDIIDAQEIISEAENTADISDEQLNNITQILSDIPAEENCWLMSDGSLVYGDGTVIPADEVVKQEDTFLNWLKYRKECFDNEIQSVSEYYTQSSEDGMSTYDATKELLNDFYTSLF